jgi:hypothetical protein
MKTIILLFITLIVFSSCTTSNTPTSTVEKPVRQKEVFKYNGRLFYEMNTAVGLLNKPQSKLWHFNGEWYGILPGDVAQNHKGTFLLHIGKKAESVDILREIFPYSGIADVFPTGNSVSIVFDSYESARFEGDRYYAELEHIEGQDNYDLKEGFPVIIGSNKGDNYVEGSTIAVDSNGVVWIAYDLSPGGADGAQNDGSVAVIHSTTEDHKSFSEPEIIHTGTISDDIAKVVAWDNKIGVFISDQARWEFRFIWREDSDDLNSWSNIEIAEQSEGNSDDHINYAYNAQKKELYFATKDSFDNVDLYKRSSEGTWSVTEKFIDGSRAMILFDASGNNLVGFTYQDVWSGSTENLVFDYLSVGNWGQSKDMTSTQQPCDSITGFVIAKKHFKKLELLYIPIEGNPVKEVDVVDWTP